MTTTVGLGLAVFGDLGCRSSAKAERTELASVPQVTAAQPPAAVAPIRFEGVESSEVDPLQVVIDDDVRRLCEVRDNRKPLFITSDGKLPSDIIIDMEILNDNWLWSRFPKPGARFAPDIIHDRMWEEERKSVLLSSPQGQ